MAMIARAAVKRGICPHNVLDVLIALLDKYHLPNRAPYAAEEIARRAGMDKKARGGTVSLIVPTGIGESRILIVKTDELIEWVREGTA